jgi:hypothetical protein
MAGASSGLPPSARVSGGSKVMPVGGRRDLAAIVAFLGFLSTTGSGNTVPVGLLSAENGRRRWGVPASSASSEVDLGDRALADGARCVVHVLVVLKARLISAAADRMQQLPGHEIPAAVVHHDV